MQRDLKLQAALNNADRLRALRHSGLLDSPKEPVYDEVTRSICQTLNVPISLVTIIAPDRQFFKSAIGLDAIVMEARQAPIEDSTCKYVVEKNCILRIDDVQKDVFFRSHEGLNNGKVGAYLGVPLRFMGEAIGSVCAADTRARKWSDQEIAFLEEKCDMLSQSLVKK